MTLAAWIDPQYRHAVAQMLRAVSPVGIVKPRPGLGRIVRPKPGSIVASPVLGDWDPEPDYFFHWYRDAAIVVDALRLLHQNDQDDGSLDPGGPAHLADFVRFTLALRGLDGRDLVATPAWRATVAPAFDGYLRTDADLARAHGNAIPAETRVNPDGSLDIFKWGRPQHDGPALTALTLLRWLRGGAPLDAGCRDNAEALIRADLTFTLDHWRKPCLDLWEDQGGQHYYTMRVQAAALEEGAAWLDEQDDAAEAEICRVAARDILRMLDDFWNEDERFYMSRLETGTPTTKACDSAVILAAIQAGAYAGSHSLADERIHATLARLEAIFAEDFPINRTRERAPALGRFRGDVYVSGGAWYIATLAAAELCYGAAVAAMPGPASALLARGDAFLATVRAFTPPSGDLSEQIDPTTGKPCSARHLAWSYAAFISCVAARRLLIDDRNL